MNASLRNRSAAILVAAVLSGCSDSGSLSVTDPAEEPAILVGEVQGSGASSPYQGQTVTIDAVVTGDFQGEQALSGFYVMGASDGDEDTSDGLFIFEGDSTPADISVGDRVVITGEVAEFFGETQLLPQRIETMGQGSFAPVTIGISDTTVTNSDGFPVADLEQFEGMLVRYEVPLTVIETYGLDRFGELMLAQGDRVNTFTNSTAPDATAYEIWQASIARRSIMLDDGSRQSMRRPVRFLNAESPVRVGDTVENVVGNLRFSRGAGGSGAEGWRLVPTEDPTFVNSNPRPDAPDVGGSLTVAAFNVLNLFTTVDEGEPVCGPAGTGRCRGADSASELQRQLSKTVVAIAAIDADIVGLVEIENNASASLEALVEALGDAGMNYTYVDTGTIGSDAIKVGFIYKPDTVTASGDWAVLDSSVDSRFLDRKSRPVLAQTFTETASGESLVVAVNHLKSKGSDCEDVGDPDLGDGQGDCGGTRTQASAAMVDWLASDPTGSGDSDILIVGDLNAYYLEPPATTITDNGYVNLVLDRDGTTSYTYVFRGLSGALDHAFASDSLAGQVTGAAVWHINADESRLLDYNEEGMRDPAWFKVNEPWRSSDHDPIVVGFDLTP